MGALNVRTASPASEGPGRWGTSDTCLACGSDDLVEDVAPRGHRLARCRRCGLRWRVDRPDDAELRDLYSSGFYTSASARGGAMVRSLHRLTNLIRLRELRDVPHGRLLDIGSGKGRFLAAARDAGWDVLGVDFAVGSAEATKAAYGIAVVTGDIAEVPIDEVFDVVTMWHVLEHLPDPPTTLERAGTLLRPGGRLVVSVPNIDSTQARFGGDAWFHLDPARHLFHFGPRSLAAMVERHGFRVERIGHLYPEMEFIGLIETALGRVGVEDDLLYRFAKRDPDARFGPKVVLSLGIAAALAPAAAIWTAVAPALRTGASIQLVATRR